MSDFPRLVYRGPADATADTKRCASAADLNEALADGWRLRRVPDLIEPTRPAPDTPTTEAPKKKWRLGSSSRS